jgi:hypothetical protein
MGDNRLNIAVEALAKIADPIGYMRKEAELIGGKLDGRMAVELSDSANYLKEIARDALRALGLGR